MAALVLVPDRTSEPGGGTDAAGAAGLISAPDGGATPSPPAPAGINEPSDRRFALVGGPGGL